MPRLYRTKFFLIPSDRRDDIGELKCLLKRVVSHNGISLLTGAESRVTLRNIQNTGYIKYPYITRKRNTMINKGFSECIAKFVHLKLNASTLHLQVMH